MRCRLNKIKKREECLGSIYVIKENPKITDLMARKSINIKLSLENILKLKLALDAAALELNTYHLGQIKARNIGANLFIGAQGQITVTIE
jgi:hypothetical protein